MPLAYPFGAGQPLGCRTCGLNAGAAPFATGSTASVGPFDVLTKTSPSIQAYSFRGHAGRGVTSLRHLPQGRSFQFAGLGPRQLRNEFDGAWIFVRRDLALDMLLQCGGQRGIGGSGAYSSQKRFLRSFSTLPRGFLSSGVGLTP